MIVVAFVGSFVLGGVFGDRIGVNRQKVEDQIQFDRINQQLRDQKAIAAAQLASLNAANLNLVMERDALKLDLGRKYETARADSLAVRRELSALKLRFTVETGVPGGGSISPAGPETHSASVAGTALIELPEKITADLRQWAEDADALRDAYALCYGFVTQVR